jgi:hypothetical protein
LAALQVLDNVCGRQGHHIAATVKTGATGATGDLLEVTHLQDIHLLPIILA